MRGQVVLFVSYLSLAACHTVAMVNGVALNAGPAQDGDAYCERNFAVCPVAGALVGGGIAVAAAGKHAAPSDPAMAGAPGISGSSGRVTGPLP